MLNCWAIKVHASTLYCSTRADTIDKYEIFKHCRLLSLSLVGDFGIVKLKRTILERRSYVRSKQKYK
jgi:hypothetical protein